MNAELNQKIVLSTAQPETDHGTVYSETASSCCIKDGDIWCFYGDSITAFGVYPRVIERVFRHFHPGARVTFINNAEGGKQAAAASAAEAVKGNPSIVSIMLGMNDAINSSWVKGMAVEPVLERYRTNMTRLVRDLKSDGREVILMTPTLTDETIGVNIFRLDGTAELLKLMGKVCVEVANAENVPCLPVQDDFERIQDSLPLREQRLRYDGVHPTSTGQYHIARILWTRMNFAAPLSIEKRTPGEPVPLLPIDASLEQHLIRLDKTRLDFIFDSKTPCDAKLSWSTIDMRDSEFIRISAQTKWSPKLPGEAFPLSDGMANDLVVDIESGGRHAVFFVDISRNTLLHMKDNKVSGHIDDKQSAGKRVCDYSFKKDRYALYFEASVKDSQLVSCRDSNAWPWPGDGLTLFLDLRPGTRFAGQGLERDVYQVWFQPQNNHGFAPGFRPWYGKGIENAATPFGEKTAGGYKVGLVVDGWFNLQERFDVSKRDFIGFDMAVVNYENPQSAPVWVPLKSTRLPTFLYAGGFTVIDLNGSFEGNSIFTANIFP